MNKPNSANKTLLYIFITVITGIAYFTVFAHRFVPAVVAVDISNDLGASAAMLGMLSSGYFYMYGLAQMPYGVLIDSVGPRKIMTVSFILAGIGGTIFAFAPSPLWSFIARLILGLGCAAALVSAMTLLARWIPKDKFPTYLTVLYIIGGLGPLAAASPLAWLSSNIGWRYACLAIALFTLVYAFVLYGVIRDYPADAVPEEKPKGRGMFSGVKTVASNVNFWLIVVFGAGIPSIYLIYCGLWAGPFMTDVYGFDKQTVGNVLSFGAIGSVLGFFLGPLFSDKIIKSRKNVMILFGSMLFVCLLPFVMQIKLSFTMLCVQVLLIGIFSCGVQPVAIMVVKDMFPINITGTAMGMFNTFPLLCGGLLQLFIGVVLSAVMNGADKATEGMYAVGFSVMSVVCAVGTVAVLFISNKKAA